MYTANILTSKRAFVKGFGADLRIIKNMCSVKIAEKQIYPKNYFLFCGKVLTFILLFVIIT